ncbi:MAG: hypothetical protein AVDCRST_MAG11-2488, partial [uncultured Gemmatimonadaceae bacterium]
GRPRPARGRLRRRRGRLRAADPRAPARHRARGLPGGVGVDQVGVPALRAPGDPVQHGRLQGALRVRLLEGVARARRRRLGRAGDGAVRPHPQPRRPAARRDAARLRRRGGAAQRGGRAAADARAQASARHDARRDPRRAPPGARRPPRGGGGVREAQPEPAARVRRVGGRGEDRRDARPPGRPGGRVDRRGKGAQLEVRAAL